MNIDDCLFTVEQKKELDTKGTGGKIRKVGKEFTIGQTEIDFDEYNRNI